MSNQRTTPAREPSWQIDRWLWRRCSAKETLLGPLILIAVALALSYILPQAPAHIRSDPISYQEWVSAIQVRFKNWTPLLETAGIFYIRDTFWFRILLAILALIILVSLGSQISLLFQPLQIRQSDAFYDAPDAILISGTCSPTQVVGHVRQAMRTLLGQVEREMDGDKAYLYGSHATWASASTSVIYLGLLFLVSSLAINGRWGWQQSNIQLLPNEPVFIGPYGSHKIELADAQTTSAEINLRVNERQRIATKWGSPTRHRGFRYQLINKGSPLIEIRAQRNNGETLTLYDYTVQSKPVESLRFAFSPKASKEEADRLFIVSQDKVVGRLEWLNRNAPEDDEKLHFRLWIFYEDGRTLVGKQEILADEGRGTATIESTTYTLDISRYVVIDVAYQPGLWASRIGIMLLIVGLLGSMIPRQRMWSTVIPQAAGVTVKIREQSQGLSYGFQRQKTKVLAHLRAQIKEYREAL